MKGLLIYDSVDVGINKWFTQHLTELAAEHGVELQLFVCNGKDTDLSGIEIPDFCINRSRFYEISEYFENCGVRSFNNSTCIRIANDKWLTYLLGRDADVPVMETREVVSKDDIPFPYPYVLKSRNGHGGKEVFMIDGDATLRSLDMPNESGYIAQLPVSQTGVDVRVYMLGGKPVAAVKRTSDSDFRSNFSLGGKVELFKPTEGQLEIIEKVQKYISADYAGFDFTRHEDQWILNEIEDAVGARMLYSLTDIDIAKDFIEYICNI